MAIDSNTKPLVTKLRKKPIPEATQSPESMSGLFADAGEDYAPADEEEDTVPYGPGKTPKKAVTPLPFGGTLNRPSPKKPRV